MEYRTIGRSNLKVSTLGLGCNNFGGRLDADGSKRVIAKALDIGVTLFDTADSYPMGRFGVSEEILGDALGARRKDVVLATKFGYPVTGRKTGASRAYLASAVEESLKRLKTDWIDLYFYHKPDPDTPLEETIRAMDDLLAAGKVRHIGCSNFSAAQIDEATRVSDANRVRRFVCSQDEYSLLARGVEKELIPTLEKHGMSLIPYFPLASGLLTGKHRKGRPAPDGTRLSPGTPLAGMFLTERNVDMAESLARFAEERGRRLVDLAFAWLLSRRPVASVIAGASSPEQLADNLRAASVRLTADELAALDRLTA